jgi:hypothetical protein
MTPSFVPENFERVMGCTSTDLLSWLPGALPAAALRVDADNAKCTAKLPDGVLTLRWSLLPDAHLASLTIPRLRVCFEYAGLSDERRYTVQKRFDLGTQRGGG